GRGVIWPFTAPARLLVIESRRRIPFGVIGSNAP
ncbi:MAG: hypothetical protein ACI8S6_002506, partial [Myxococcota bacterium]